MKRMLVWVVPFFCLLLGPSLVAQAPFPAGFDGELYFAPRIDLVPAADGGPYKVVLDGVLNEPVWQRAAFHTVNTFLLDTGQPAELDPPSLDWDMIFAVCADQDFMYVAWKIVDDTLITGETPGCNVWQDDSIEIYIDADNNGPNCTSGTTSCYAADDAQITVGADQIGNEPGNPDQRDCPDGTPVEECLKFGGVAGKGSCDFGPPAPELCKGVVVELQHGDLTGAQGAFGQGLAGWQAEVAIALNTTGNAADGTPAWDIIPDGKTCIGFSMQGNDDDGPEITDRDHKLAWAKRETTESAWRNPGVFGKLTFFDPTKPVSTGACALPVENLTCKRNADGTVTATWKNPGTKNAAIPTKVQVDAVEKATVAGDATTATLAEADVPKDGKDHVITVINNSDETPPTCTIIQAPFAECGGIRFWNMLGAFDQPNGAAPTDDQMRLDYMTDGSTTELDFEWKAGAQIHTDLNGAAASTALRSGFGAPPKNPGKVPTVFTWQDLDSRVSFSDVFRQNIPNTMAYAQCYVNNTTGSPMDVYLGISSDDSIQVYLNGAEVWIHSVPRPSGDACVPDDISPDGLIFTDPFTLDPGQNSVILKIFQGTGEWQFAFRFQDGNGVDVEASPITEGLDISLTPSGTPPKKEDCTDGKDNDGDGLVDCKDPDCPPCLPSFHRGDADGNGQMQLTDAVRILNVLFLGTGVLPCADAADADDNGQIQLTDAVRILNVLFLGTGTIPLPGSPLEACGSDPTPADGGTDLGCESYTRC